MTEEASSLSAVELVRRFRQRTLSPVEVVRDTLDRIDRFNPIVNAFAVVSREAALTAARQSEARWHKSEPGGLLDGVPATVKDNVWVKGLPARFGSLISNPSPRTEDAPAVARLREHGAIIVGKTTMPEYGWVGACHSPLTGVTRNPWNLDRTPGGSSGGAAAAALLNLGCLHVGTDGAGSIRIPASFTGVFGFKPSFGRVPVYPPPVFSVLFHLGPMTRSVADAALLLGVISAPDDRDMSAWNAPAANFRAGLEDGVCGLKIAWSPRLGHIRSLDPEVEAAAATAARVFADLGAVVEEADPDLADSVEVMSAMWGALSAALVAGIPEQDRSRMDPGLLAMAENGKRYDLKDYLAAFNARGRLAQNMAQFHRRYDLLLTPQMPVTAIPAGSNSPAGGPAGSWLDWSPYTYPFNLTQQPAASVPCGFSSDGLPIGLQIVGPARGDAAVLRAAWAFERLRPFPTLNEPRSAQ